MAGTPRSTGCEACKQKRIRCDKKWPTCSRCKQLNRVCPGPSALIKFVDNGRSQRSSPPGARGRSAARTKQADQVKSLVMIDRSPLKPYGGGRASYGAFRLEVPRPRLTTTADRVGARLVDLLEQDPSSVFASQMRYLPYIPQRLTHNFCLRECTALFCFAWRQYRCGQPAEKLLVTRQYSRAIHSLRDSLHSDQLYTPEMVCAMTLMERVKHFFSIGLVENTRHFRGIQHVLQQKGTPNPDDDLDLALAFEYIGIMQPRIPGKGQNSYVTESPWKELLQDFGQKKLAKNDHNYLWVDPVVYDESLASLSGWIQDIRRIRANADEMREAKNTLHDDISKQHIKLANLITKSIDTATGVASIRKVSDPDFFIGYRYEFESIFVARQFIAGLSLRMRYLRILYDLGALYGAPDESIHSQYRAVCLQHWMYIPYLSTIDPISALDLAGSISPSFEAADDLELGLLIEKLLGVDNYFKRLPREKDTLKTTISIEAKLLTGRI